MTVRTVALAVALACGFTAAGEAWQEPVSGFRKAKEVKVRISHKPPKYKAPKYKPPKYKSPKYKQRKVKRQA